MKKILENDLLDEIEFNKNWASNFPHFISYSYVNIISKINESFNATKDDFSNTINTILQYDYIDKSISEALKFINNKYNKKIFVLKTNIFNFTEFYVIKSKNLDIYLSNNKVFHISYEIHNKLITTINVAVKDNITIKNGIISNIDSNAVIYKFEDLPLVLILIYILNLSFNKCNLIEKYFN